jgi:L-asparagine permease
MQPAHELRPEGDAQPVTSGDEGYEKSLAGRQVQMIAIGGAIGVGLFYGTGGRIAAAGPGLVLGFAVAGVVAFFVLRAMGELVLYRPTAGSFVEYSREFIGPWAGFVTGWMYWLNWAATGVAEITAVGIYIQFWEPAVPQWVSALAALGLLLTVNLISVRLFGELEFWFSMLKVAAIVAFLATGVYLVAAHSAVGDSHASVANLTSHGGFFPLGFPVVLMSLQAVVFAYAGTEMVGVTAGETRDVEHVIPKAVNGVIWRIALFYVGSVLLLVMVLPWTDYGAAESPFVTVFAKIGVPAAASIMNGVVLIAALSSTNSGLYSTGRILRSLALRGEAPKFTLKMSSHHVPYGGIMLTCAVYFLGVLLNLVVPHRAFDIATALASLGVLSTWISILVCQLRLRARAARGTVRRPAYRMPGAPVTNLISLALLALVLCLMPFANSEQAIAFACLPVLAAVLWYGWRRSKRGRSLAPGAERGMLSAGC